MKMDILQFYWLRLEIIGKYLIIILLCTKYLLSTNKYLMTHANIIYECVPICIIVNIASYFYK